MNSLEMQVKFQDILETTSRAFGVTIERPYSTTIFEYLNEAQEMFFRDRYLPGSFTQNIQTIKSLKGEIPDLLAAGDVELSPHATYNQGPALNTVWVAEAFGKTEHLVDGFLKVTRADILAAGDINMVETQPMDENQILNKYFTNYMNVPIILQPIIFYDTLSKKIAVVIDKYTTIEDETPEKLYYTKLIYPVKLDPTTDCELNPKFHETIVRQATELFIRDKVKLAGASQPQQQPQEGERERR